MLSPAAILCSSPDLAHSCSNCKNRLSVSVPGFLGSTSTSGRFCLLYLPLPDPQARTATHTSLLDRAQHLLPADLHLPGFVSSVQAQKEFCRLQVAVREQSASPLQNTSTCFFVCVHAVVTMQKTLSTNLALGEQASLQEISSQQVDFAAPYLLLLLWTGCDWYAQQGTAHNMISCSGKGSKLVQDTPACASHWVQPILFRYLT